jgi:hypothetical protein
MRPGNRGNIQAQYRRRWLKRRGGPIYILVGGRPSTASGVTLRVVALIRPSMSKRGSSSYLAVQLSKNRALTNNI